MKSQGKKVFVGLSGGVDSAVSAALLKKMGYEVTGVFIKVWQPDWIECSWREERRDAMRAAAHLGIPFVTLDLDREYKQGVIDYMLAEYEQGRTPNPDVMCNRKVKFGAFYDWAMLNGADFVATGHYARIRIPGIEKPPTVEPATSVSRRERKLAGTETLRRDEEGEGFSLMAGRDQNKDQSYFLWTLKQEQLPRILFPVGDLTKPEVRKLAEKLGLPNAGKKDSQGLCFIGKIDLKEFLAHYVKTERGNVLDESGGIIGTHPGALFFTMGERHGFTVDKKTRDADKLYVIDKDMDQNTITVAARARGNFPSAGDMSRTVRISQVNWIMGSAPEGYIGVKTLQARGRYRQTLESVIIKSIGLTEAAVEFEKPQKTATSGQSLVIYDGDECLGGGVID
ncbi:tRNA-specific 2-thiouridylase [Patescibacteria group bacterium]|nr:tRNA-specific 2-thiouridylase [Patescibacteria group bacterium]MDE1946585.1 tRNA-specific 2-thiouridylase [Patescibacteria group bacterium]MDE2010852.1 tRNA-specific 2-thiouridylase [Patescibacteria group bacterium]MDE2233212.1 tRNA-specific 2-thiouridylase [Patescibacteria group bacterium]